LYNYYINDVFVAEFHHSLKTIAIDHVAIRDHAKTILHLSRISSPNPNDEDTIEWLVDHNKLDELERRYTIIRQALETIFALSDTPYSLDYSHEIPTSLHVGCLRADALENEDDSNNFYLTTAVSLYAYNQEAQKWKNSCVARNILHNCYHSIRSAIYALMHVIDQLDSPFR
jgi:hypothetical protein